MTAYVPNVLMTAARMALPPSITKSRGCSTCSPRSIRLPNSALQTVLFSVVPSHRPSGCLRPSVSTPRATTMQCSATSTPSMNIATRSSWLRSRPNSSPSFCSVPWIKRCEIADLDVARASTRPTGSRPAEYRRVESPASILPNAASLSRSRLANVRKVRSSSSSSSTLRTRGLLTSTRRPPSVTWRCSWPCRYARRSASCFPFGPASRTTSASNSSSSTASPMPTEKASSPSFATPASSRRAIVTCLGRSCASRSLDAVTMRGRGMVVTGGLSFGLDTPFVTTTVKRGGGPPSISTNYRTTSKRTHVVAREHVIVDGPTAPSMVKALFIASRMPGLSLAEMSQHWFEVHGPLVSNVPGLRRYVQNHAVAEAYALGRSTHDGWAEMWFDDLPALRTARQSAEWKALQQDVGLFAQPMAIVVAREGVRKPPPSG